jgi:probable F420-dependent oxidoreductase
MTAVEYTRAVKLGAVVAAFPALPLDDYLALVRDVEARGYHTAWCGEAAGGDAITLMTLIASHTQRIGVASGVIPIQTRSPIVLGMSAATLAHVAPGRVSLGLGVSSRIIVEQWHGLPFHAGLGQMRESVQVIRMTAAGERVNFEGKYYRLKNFKLTAPRPPEPPKIVLAALGPEMLELAGEIADGVLLNWIPPEAVPASIKHLEAGARRAGRTLDGFEIAGFVRTTVTDEADTARAQLARDITGYAIVDVYANFFRSVGYTDEMAAINAAWKAGDRAGAVREVSPRLLDGLGVVGDEAFCRGRIKAYAAAGMTMPVILPFVPEGADRAASLRRTLAAFP